VKTIDASLDASFDSLVAMGSEPTIVATAADAAIIRVALVGMFELILGIVHPFYVFSGEPPALADFERSSANLIRLLRAVLTE
jgi:hypothetical protein